MLIQPINTCNPGKNFNYNSKNNHLPVQQTEPPFEGKKGALIGGIAGAVGTVASVAATGGLALIPAFVGYIAVLTGMGTAAGHLIEDDIKKISEK